MPWGWSCNQLGATSQVGASNRELDPWKAHIYSASTESSFQHTFTFRKLKLTV